MGARPGYTPFERNEAPRVDVHHRSLSDRRPPGPRGHGPHEGDRASTSRWGDRLFGGAQGLGLVRRPARHPGRALPRSSRPCPRCSTTRRNFLTSTEWVPSGAEPRFGIAALLWATVITSVIAMLIAVPLGVAVALFITGTHPHWLSKPCRDHPTSSPPCASIVFGFWGLSVAGQYFQPVQDFPRRHLPGSSRSSRTAASAPSPLWPSQGIFQPS